MGNCNQNFENIQEDNDIFNRANLQASPQIGLEHQQLKPEHPPNFIPHVIDEEAIQPTIVRKLQPPLKLTEKSKSDTPVMFPEPSSVVQQSEPPEIIPPVVKKVRPKLEELDLTFYHKLALPDYEYRPIPEGERHLFANVETYEMKDNYGVKYLGQWLNNNIHGNGVLLSNTAKYIGQFKNGLKHYHGREILKNQVYEGMFEGGRRKGEGIRYTETFTELGLFDDELVDGKIIHIDGREETKTKYVEIEENQLPNRSHEQIAEIEHPAAEIYTEKYYEQSELPPEWQDTDLPEHLNKQSK